MTEVGFLGNWKSESQKIWYANNRDKQLLYPSKQKEYRKKYYLKNKEKIKEKNKLYPQNRRDGYFVEYYQENKNKIKAYPSHSSENRKKQYKKIKSKYEERTGLTYYTRYKITNNHRRHIRRLIEKETDITGKWLKNLFDSTSNCVVCSITMIDKSGKSNSKELDHILPINVGGLHKMNNVRYICSKCNRSRPKDGSDISCPA